jgi:hypothetical protein
MGWNLNGTYSKHGEYKNAHTILVGRKNFWNYGIAWRQVVKQILITCS